MSDWIRTLAALWEDAPVLSAAALITLKASVIVALTGVVARLLRRLSAAKRHLLWRSAIAAAAVIPLVTFSLPSWRIQLHYSGATQLAPIVSAVDSWPGVTVGVAAAAEAGSQARAANRVSEASSLGAASGERAPARVGPSVTAALFVVWFAGAVLVLLPWAAGVSGRARLARRASDLLPATWERSLRSLRAEGLVPARVRVLSAPECATPMAWGVVTPVVLVPAFSTWQEHERRNALLHEFAHVRRGDYVSKLASRLLCSVYWFNPFVWMAARAERLSREQACDDAVLRSGSRPSAYAQQLLEVASGGGRPLLAAAALTMARGSNLATRLRAILDPTHDRSPTGRSFASAALGSTLALVPPLAAFSPEWVLRAAAPQAQPVTAATRDSAAGPARNPLPLPALPPMTTAARLRTVAAVPAWQEGECPATGKRSSTSVQSNDDGARERRRWQVKWSNGACRIELDARGEFTLSPNADDVVAITRGGYLDLLHDDGRTERRLRIERGDAALERTYWIDRRRSTWNADAAAWFARTLILLDRRTAFAVETRLPRLLERGGVDAVLAETALMPSAYAQRVYFSKLFEVRTLTAEQLLRVLDTASRNPGSAYEKAELLLRVAKQATFAEPVHLAFAQLARSIDSDYEKRRALGALLARGDLKPAVVRTMLQATEGMRSDYELAELLIAIDRRYAVDDSTRPHYVRALATIDSDYEQRRVLSAIMRAGGLPATVTGEVIGTAGRSMKGYELAEFLVDVAANGTLDETTTAVFFEAARNVQSDYERRRVLATLLKRGQLTSPVVEGILTTAATIDSDFECAELLVALSRAVKIDDTLRPAFERAAATIESDNEYGRVMSAMRRSAPRT